MNQGKRTGITFGCGHHGLGTTCHRCEQANRLEAMAREGVIITYEPSKKKKVQGIPRQPVKRKANKQQIEALLKEAARLRARPGQKPTKIIADIQVQSVSINSDGSVGVAGKVNKPQPTIEALQDKFAKYGAVSAKTLKSKQKGKKP